MGEKVKQIRQAKGATQQQLSDELSITRSRLSQLENGEDAVYGDFSPDTLMQIQRALKVMGLPLIEADRMGFKHKLFKWNDLIASRKIEEAKEMRQKLSVITFAPFDEELNVLFNLIDSRLELSFGNILAAEEILKMVEDKYSDNLNNEFKSLYYRSKGWLYYLGGKFQESLSFVMKAFELGTNDEQNAGIYLTIAMALNKCGYMLHSCMFLEEGLKLCEAEQNSTLKRHMSIMLVNIYIGLNHLVDAKGLLDKMYREAKDTGDNKFLCGVLLGYGYMFRCAGSYGIAHDYFDEAMEYADKESEYYLEVLYQRARCCIAAGGFATCEELLEEGKLLSKNNKHDTIMFNSLGHLTTLKKDESIEYLETITLPHLLNEVPDYAVALDYCECLRRHYEQKSVGTIKKALETEKLITHIYKLMFSKGALK